MDTITSLNDASQNNKKIKVAINGFGRIGRQFFKVAFDNPNIQVVAINDLGSIDNLAYLLEFDSVYKKYDKAVSYDAEHLIVNDVKINFYTKPNPLELPWKALDVDVLVECTGIFNTTEKATPHITAGAKRVVISAPAKDTITPTFTPNINEAVCQQSNITSNASCTSNATTPLVAVCEKYFGIESAMVNTIHAVTATQTIVDAPGGKDYRRGRAGYLNIVPSSSGAAEAVERVVPSIKGKMDAMALRVPVSTGSIVDFTFVSKKQVTVEEVNKAFEEESKMQEWQGILEYNTKQIVSSDIVQNPHGCIFDSTQTKVANGNLVKIMAWYDNEWGYVNMMLKHVIVLSKSV